MKYRFFILLVVLLPIVCFVKASATESDNLTYNISNHAVTITKCDVDAEGEMIIPEEVEGLPVTKIGPAAFQNCVNITSVIMPDTITEIGPSAFFNCSDVINVHISKAVTTIPYSAFGNCSGLTNVTIHENITNIAYSAFRNCTNLINISIPDTVTYIGGYAFSNTGYYNTANNWDDGILYIDNHLVDAKNISNNNIIVKENVRTIAEYAFSGRNILTNITIPNGLISIGAWAFQNCSNLKSILIPSSVSYIGDCCFIGCVGLSTLNVDIDNLFYFSDADVLFNKSITTLIHCAAQKSGDYIVPDTVTTIEGHAFRGCSKLTSVILPNGVTRIADDTFVHCTSIKKIVLGNRVSTIGSGAFEYCTSLCDIEIPNSVTTIMISAFAYCNSLKSINIPNSVRNIATQVFYGCTGLETVTIGSGVTSIGDTAFFECINLEKIDVNENNLYYTDVDGVLYTKDMNTVVCCPKQKEGVYVIPNTVVMIGNSAFSHCSNLTNVIIPNSVTSIGSQAFRYCTSLTGLKLSPNIVSIDRFAFADTNIKNLILPYNLKDISDYMFLGCEELISVGIPKSVVSIGYSSFDRCRKLKNTYYIGTEEEWKSISISSYNSAIINSNIYYNSKPSTKTIQSADKRTFLISPILIDNSSTIILALFKDNVFINLYTNIYDGNDVTFVVEEDYDEAKVMVWKDLSRLIPLCDVEVLPNNEL